MLFPYALVILITLLVASGVPSHQRIGTKSSTENRPKSIIFFVGLTGLILTLVSALRWRVGTDYWSYEVLYTSYIKEPFSEFTFFSEPGIRVLAKFGAHINAQLGQASDPALMFAFAAALTIPLMVWTIYKSTNMFAFAILLFILTTTWQSTFNGVRQYIACAILFWGHQYILSRHFRKYFVIVFIASLFHISAAIMLLVYWLPRKVLKPHALLLLAVVSIVAISSFSSVLEVISVVKSESLTTGGYVSRQINPLRIGISLAPILVYILFSTKSRLGEREHFYLNMLIVNTALLVVSLNSAYFARFTIYTSIYACVLIPNLINMRDVNTRRLTILFIVVCYSLLWILETRQQPEMLYRTIFSRPT